MTRLWTDNDPTVDAALNERLAGLRDALASYLGREVIFHDAGGNFAPVIEDGRTHIHLHGSPRPARPGRNAPTAPRQVNHFPGDVFDYHALPRINASSSREVENVNCNIRGARNQRIAQVVNNTYFVLIRPTDGTDDGSISVSATENVVLHTMLMLAAGTARRAPSVRPSHMNRHQRERLLADFPELDPLMALIRRSAVRTSVEHVLHRNGGDPAAHLRAERDSAANQERNAQRDLDNASERLRELRQQRMAQTTGNDDATLRETFREEMRQIRDLPQTISADIMHDGRIKVWLKPMLLSGGNRNGNRHRQDRGAVVGPICLTLHPGTLNPRAMALISDPFDSSVPHPHVRGSPCLGSISEPLRSALQNGNLSVAVQLMIGFLQTYNVDDAWGRVGANWTRWTVDRGSGNQARLPLPAAQPDTQEPAETQDQPNEAAA